MKATELRPSMAVRIDNNLYVITQFAHITPGNWRGMVQLKIKNVASGLVLDRRFRSEEDVEQVDLDRRDMEYIYTDSTGHVFMDTKTYDQMTLPDVLVGESMVYLVSNTVVTVLFCEGKPVAVDLPKVVELLVKDTPPGIKGATATNQSKEALMETGLKTRVPPFIGNGEKIRISTEDGSYQSRA